MVQNDVVFVPHGGCATPTRPVMNDHRFEFDRDRFKRLVHYVCSKADDPGLLGATKLNKILFYIDFLSYLSSGRPVTGEVYIKRQFGPVPRDILPVIEELRSQGALVTRDRTLYARPKRDFISLVDPDISMFEPEEISLADVVIAKILYNHTAESISDLSHDEVWEIATIGEEIPYESIYASTSGEIDESDLEWVRTDIEEDALENR